MALVTKLYILVEQHFETPTDFDVATFQFVDKYRHNFPLEKRMSFYPSNPMAKQPLTFDRREARILLDALDTLTPHLSVSELNVKAVLVEKLRNVGTNK